MSRYYRENPEEPIRHDWLEGARTAKSEGSLAPVPGYAARGHVLITPQTCGCDKRSDRQCNVCDGGLAICAKCGAAEIELDRECTGEVRHIDISP